MSPKVAAVTAIMMTVAMSISTIEKPRSWRRESMMCVVTGPSSP
jgi:hypothetical protein